MMDKFMMVNTMGVGHKEHSQGPFANVLNSLFTAPDAMHHLYLGGKRSEKHTFSSLELLLS